MLCMLLLVAGQSSANPAEPIVRDGYGVPHISASSASDAWMWAGYATAEDRLWQMEQSRRLARGKMSEAFGAKYVASDTEILKSAYTDEEIQQQIDALPASIRDIFDNYAKGINRFIAENRLPAEFSKYGLKPEPWTSLDTAAIAIRLFQQFGKGGAGEIRNLALLGYLQNRTQTKDRALDVLNDFSWQNDPAATTTINARDDLSRGKHPTFSPFSKSVTEAHLKLLPKLSLLELLPGIRLASHETSNEVAEMISAPYKWGSYAIVVGPERSGTGHPLLLSAPQMGHRAPSILHEMSIDAPGVSVVGVDVPGVPGVIIGKTKSLAWGLTSGVADTDDIFVSTLTDADHYLDRGSEKQIEKVAFKLSVKGEGDREVTQLRTSYGPVVVLSGASHAALSRKSSYWMRELQATLAIYNLYSATTPAEIDKAVQVSPMSFNFFWATKDNFGYRFVGHIPQRAKGLDPRLPTPGDGKHDWTGEIPQDAMPHAMNPTAGLLANWNNKPADWWPNLDTPVWGRIFRNSAVLAQLEKPILQEHDLEMAAWWIARTDYTYPYFSDLISRARENFAKKRFIKDPGPIVEAMAALKTYDGRNVDGSQGALVYAETMNAIRELLFLPVTGNFLSNDNFQLVTQPTVIWNALNRKTTIDYLAGRKPEDLMEQAIGIAGERLAARLGRSLEAWRYLAPSIKWGDEPPVPYSDRGTMIQIIDLSTMTGRNVVPPGVAESGPHAFDQVPLARAWTYKLMKNRP